jgi:hypothetical protein
MVDTFACGPLVVHSAGKRSGMAFFPSFTGGAVAKVCEVNFGNVYTTVYFISVNR